MMELLSRVLGLGIMMVVVLLVCQHSTTVDAINPIVFFPGYSVSKLNVEVQNGQLENCPTEGSFSAYFGMDPFQNGFTEPCMVNYMALEYVEHAPFGKKFVNRKDVTISIPGRETGSAECLGGNLYAPLISFLQSKGYDNSTLLMACWDWRIDPTNDAIEGPSFLENTENLIKAAYHAAGKQKVYLIGHSNGPMMALYFLNHVSFLFRREYIAGFIPLSGNFAGQGLFIGIYLQGLSLVDFNFQSYAAPIQANWSQNMFSLPQPEVFSGQNQETLLSVEYPPKIYNVSYESYDEIFSLAGLNIPKQLYREYIGLIGPHKPPRVRTWAFWGAGFETVVGIKITDFASNALTGIYSKEGDISQEAVTNESPNVWSKTMPAGCYAGTPMPGVDHFSLVSNKQVLDSIWTIVSNPHTTHSCEF